ncbi:MAG: GNAT family N-acetyltransferase [Anaerolineales bacterium]|nr:GNAT family N-acetyltransferase [Anaerolineales bacterium]
MIREVNTQDANDMAELLRQLSSSDEASVTEETVAAIKAKIADMSQLEHMMVFGYELDGKIVGTCTLGRVEGLSKGCRPFAIIENVVVLDAIRSRGIGKQLVRHAMTQAEKWNCYKVILETGTKDEWKLRFYDSCGLTRGGKTAFMKRF